MASGSSTTCVCGHHAVHHDKRKSIYQGLMADYKVIWACGWAGCGCPRFVKATADSAEDLPVENHVSVPGRTRADDAAEHDRDCP